MKNKKESHRCDRKKDIMENIGMKLGRTVAGVACCLICAEVVAIGTNAMIDDSIYVYEQAEKFLHPEPVKKGLFGRIKKTK